MSFSGESTEAVKPASKKPVAKKSSNGALTLSSVAADATGRLILVAVAIIAAAITWGAFAATHTTPGATSVATYLNNGVAKANAGSYLAAEGDYIQAILADPTNKLGFRSLAYYDLGVCFQRTSFPDVAAAYYNKSLALNANDVAAWYNLGIAQVATPTAALYDYNKALALNPSYPQALLNSGIILYKSGQTTEGATRIAKAVALDAALASHVPSNIKY